MSVIFGVCLSAPAAIICRDDMLGMAVATARYGGDDTAIVIRGSVAMCFQEFRTHRPIKTGQQPNVDSKGNIALLDGRIDNRLELATAIGIDCEDISDSEVVLSAFLRWGADSFSRFIGEWAIALWSAKTNTLYLARDHAGTRNLFYQVKGGDVTWSTCLETFCDDIHLPEVDQEYVARFISFQATVDLTPYRGIHAVPPAHYVEVRAGETRVCPHWMWIADRTVVYKSDAEYDEHFLHLFSQAVRRRIGPGAPIVAELSGGMDSTGIVCMADLISKASVGGIQELDTVSYYDDGEPNWNERPYVTAMEAHRGKTGIHIDFSSHKYKCEPIEVKTSRYPYPIGDQGYLDSARTFDDHVKGGQYRVILSGIGGDELLGGVPTGTPELADHLRTGQLVEFISRTMEWCMVGRTPLIHMLYQTGKLLESLYLLHNPPSHNIPPWLSQRCRRLCTTKRFQEKVRPYFDAALPSQLANGETWWDLLETLPSRFPRAARYYEYRYPYLDRDLVEFLHRIPRKQLVGPGRRRLLMRRALNGIVPEEILERRRKAFISRGPITGLREAKQKIEAMFEHSVAECSGVIDSAKFMEAFQQELSGQLKWIGQLRRTIDLELWMRSVAADRATVQERC